MSAIIEKDSGSLYAP